MFWKVVSLGLKTKEGRVIKMIGLIDIDSKIPNLALMKISAFYKSVGEKVELVSLLSCRVKKLKNVGDIRKAAIDANRRYSKIYASTIFTRSQYIIDIFMDECGEKVEFGGTGSYNPQKQLLPEIDLMKPDYDLYTATEIASRITGIGTREHKFNKAVELVTAGHGFSSRGCIRNCPFCMVPKCEGCFHQAASISELLNPKSRILVLHDNNLTADPNCIDKLKEIRDRKLIVDINQGCDVRLIDDDIAKAMSEVDHLRSIHYAWDLLGFENQVLDGIKTLSKYIKPYRHMCFVLVGYNTTYEDDWYRCSKLMELGVDPYVMIYNENEKGDERLKHFARWVNSRIYKTCTFAEYVPWKNAQKNECKQLKLFI